ncbi:MAG TPA: creatininase family protein [Gemmatimonadales bacterium]
MSTPLRLKEMTPAAAREAAAANPRIIVPVGTTEQHGPHLALGADTVIVERLADDLSAEFQVLRAPTIEYGVNDAALERQFSGGASVRRKTLRRWVNDLLPDWEQLGIGEILMFTMNAYAPHQEALGTVVARKARVRVIDVLAMDFSSLVEFPDDPIHGGEIDTSLALFICPQLVKMDVAIDYILPEPNLRRYRRGSSMSLPFDSLGSVGRARAASAEKGRRLYEHIVSRIRERVFE